MTNVYQKLIELKGFSSAQKTIIEQINPNSSVLEIGCSYGYMTKILFDRKCEVSIVENDVKAAKAASRWSKLNYIGSIEDENIRRQIVGKYDYIICADVLEHLINPEETLEYLKHRLKADGIIIISIPNIAFWDMRLQLFIKGDFTYQQSGLLDQTHLRFYTYNGLLNVLKSHNISIIEIIPTEFRIPFEYTLHKIPVLGSLILKTIKSKIIKSFPNLTIYHYVVKANVKK